MRGQPDAIRFVPALPEAVSCARAGASYWVRLRIEGAARGDGRLWCEARGGRAEILRWPDGEARFAFSEDGRSWSNDWAERTPAPGGPLTATRHAPLVRFELVQGGRRLTWIVNAGSAEAIAAPTDFPQ